MGNKLQPKNKADCKSSFRNDSHNIKIFTQESIMKLPNSFEDYFNSKQFIFYWKSKADSSNNSETEKWKIFDDKNQFLLREKYFKYLQNLDRNEFRLFYPFHNFNVYFDSMAIYSWLENKKILIKIEKIENEMPNKQINDYNQISKESLSLKKQLSDKLDLIDLSNFKTYLLEEYDEEEFQFFWNSKQNPFDETQPDCWEPFLENNQVHLNLKYREFTIDKTKDTAILLPPSDDYSVNFLNLIQFSFSDQNKINPIKFEKIKYRFFWKSNKDPWDKNQEALWTPYDLEDEYLIKRAYREYLKDKQNKYVNLKISADHFIDFSKMLQISKKDQNKQRPVQRFNPKLVTKIARTDRFELGHLPGESNNQMDFDIIQQVKIEKKWECLSIFDNLNKEKYKSINIINFNIFPEFSCKLEIEEGLSFFNNNFNIDISLEEIKFLLIEEISNLGKNVNRQSSEYITKLMEINDSKNFFTTIVYIYTLEGYLYSNLNTLLRTFRKPGFYKIKYYYTCLLASFHYFSFKTKLNSYLNENNDLMVYRGSRLSNEEFEQYKQKNMKNIIRVFKEFISTSISKDISLTYFDKYDSSQKQFFWEIKIPKILIEQEPYNFADISEASDFPNEKEVLLRSGAIIEIEEIIPYTEKINNKTIIYPNKFKKICNLKSFSLSSFFNIISLNSSISELNLDNNNLGTNEKNMLFLKEALNKNNSISFLLLNNNSLGINTNNMKFLKEALIKNNKIHRLSLNNNNLGENEMNMLLLKEALLGNNSISELFLVDNNLGINEKNMLFLKEALIKNNLIDRLGLDCNNLGMNEKNMLFLKEALEINNTIVSLGLDNNNLGDNDMNILYLKEALIQNKSISQLGLGSNNLGKKEINMKFLKEALEKNHSISELYLGSNNLGENKNNIIFLKEALEKNNSITKLSISSNNLQIENNILKNLSNKNIQISY